MGHAVVALAVATGLAGCEVSGTIGLSSDPTRVGLVEQSLRFSGRDRIDVLLTVDDSGGMGDKQKQFLAELPRFITSLAATNVQRALRVGVVTSDLGAPGITCGRNLGGHLQAIGKAADAACQAPIGDPWITLTAAGDNLPSGQTLEATLRCMTAVGETGCGFEMPLEAVRRQLTNPPDGDEPFARDDALLVIVLLTDEDDCSADAESDLFTSNPSYGPLNSFRCPRHGVLCGGGLIGDSPGTYENCRPATAADGGKLLDPSIYFDLFSRSRALGGVKDDPADVVLAGLYAPAAPFATTSGAGAAVCGAGSDSCTVMAHSCQAPSAPSLYGDPAVRLDAVLQAVGGVSRSICDTSYRPFADTLLARVEAAASGNACVPGPLANPAQADCTVRVDGAPIPPCVGGIGDAGCWLVAPDASCPAQVDPRDGSAQHLGMIVGAPLDHVIATCRVLAAR